MPRAITELSQGNTFSLSSDGGGDAYSATRSWKVILSSPGEYINVNDVTGVNIGDPYSSANPIPCVSVEGRPDGDSRLVKIITATYRATVGGGGGDATDPKTQSPAVRPAMYSMTTTLTEIAAWGGNPIVGGSSVGWQPAVNPAGDLVDGLTRLEPVVTINIDQYSTSDQSGLLAYTGYVNSGDFTFSGLSIAKHCAMLQGISSRPVVETFGNSIFRGFMVTFSFGVRAHWAITRDGFQPIGWDMAVPLTGFTIINDGLDTAGIDPRALVLQHDEATGNVKIPLQYASHNGQSTQGDRVRAMVTIPSRAGGWAQNPAAQPVALNDNGTPRDTRTANPKVLINRICLQPEMPFGDNFSSFGIRMIG